MENKRQVTAYLLFIILIQITGCSKDLDFSGLFHSRSDADERFSQSMKQDSMKFPAEIMLETNSYGIVFAADCHVGGTDNLSKLLNQIKEPGINALFLAGDVTTGKIEDYKVVEQILDKTDSLPYYIIAGNHDLFYDGWTNFLSCFGPSTYTISIETPGGSDLFICLDTGGGTLGERQLNWLKEILQNQRSQYRNCIVITHNNFFRTHVVDSSNPLIEEINALLELFYTYQVNIVVAGHDHTRSVEVFGVTTYITLDALEDGSGNASYLKMIVKDGIIGYQFQKLSD